ncbi:MAG: hypothetical protein GAK31_00281 [Stenotrophomonas maltophilia]|uniref:Uncharacterized protein n=1 Tax=Stenotrophomonas maltophilia TaxID=40324 RepID=A0A7V8JMS2_STEMA|nr:MAG: hypothetical protein GAK31_00281 [Stenotrophomonas maltophilia]
MSPSIVPTTYDSWKHCIEVDCRQPLTLAYIRERRRALADPRDHHTQQFERRWGAAQLQRVQAWFAQAEAEQAP